MINPPKPPTLIKGSFLKSPWIPGVLIAGVATTMALNALGIIALPHISLPNLNIIEPPKESVYTFPPSVTVGKYMEYDFSTALINQLEPQGRETPEIYSFYLGPGFEGPPLGLSLNLFTGVLSGIPKERLTIATDSKFQVCVKDVGGKSSCRTYVMPVAPKVAVTPKKPSKSPAPAPKTPSASTPTTLICPANSHFNPSDSTKCACDTGYQTNSAGNGCEPKKEYCPTATEMGCGSVVSDGIGGRLGLEGTFQSASCGCPSGTVHDSSGDRKNIYGVPLYYCKCSQ